MAVNLGGEFSSQGDGLFLSHSYSFLAFIVYTLDFLKDLFEQLTVQKKRITDSENLILLFLLV